ncbi:MAG: vWA domain-containing protein [Minisyncoccia bacterium]
MFRPWAFWRRVEYGVGFFVVFTLCVTGLYYLFGYTAPTCFDSMQNADERAIDCGGSCMRMCLFDISAPTALWADSFRVIEGQYNAVAYIENRNANIGSPALSYTIKLFDAQGLITERNGTTVLPPDSVYPIFEGRILTGDRTPTKTTISFDDAGAVWQAGEAGREQFTLEKRDLVNADSKPRLTAELHNNSLEEGQDVEIVATIFDVSGRPLTAARTVVPYFKGRSTESVVFTWPEPIAKTLKSCEIPTDVVLGIDLSGSMNNDGGTPPEPISSVLRAAEAFVSRIKAQDKVGVATYASEATIEEMLTHEKDRVVTSISKLKINPKEETGNTNTGEGIKRMREELSSSRHNENARKVAILLTDGLATAPEKDPEIYAQTAADALKADGVILYTIGLGMQVNEAALKKLATSEDLYFNAPSINDLNAIYKKITASICEEGAAVIEIIPKAKTSFPPLQ